MSKPVADADEIAEREGVSGPTLALSKCSGCGRWCEKLHYCAGCGLTRYCSKECQRRSWSNGHKSNCGMFRLIRTSHGGRKEALVSIVKGGISQTPGLSAGVQGLIDMDAADRGRMEAALLEMIQFTETTPNDFRVFSDLQRSRLRQGGLKAALLDRVQELERALAAALSSGRAVAAGLSSVRELKADTKAIQEEREKQKEAVEGMVSAMRKMEAETECNYPIMRDAVVSAQRDAWNAEVEKLTAQASEAERTITELKARIAKLEEYNITAEDANKSPAVIDKLSSALGKHFTEMRPEPKEKWALRSELLHGKDGQKKKGRSKKYRVKKSPGKGKGK